MVILVLFKVLLVVKNLDVLIQIVPYSPIYYYYYLPKGNIMIYNVMINGKNFYDQLIHSDIKR